MKISSIYIPMKDKSFPMSGVKKKKKIKRTARAELLGILLGGLFCAAGYYITGVLLWVVLG